MRKTLAIIGAGHVGAVLGRLFAHSGAVTLQDVLTRSPASAQAGVTFIGAGCAVDRLAALRPAQVYMLAVPDHQIAPVCAALAADRALDGALVFHCSGARTSAELGSAARRGALTASVHPIRSFADPA